MSTHAEAIEPHVTYPVDVIIQPALTGRNRLTSAFRLILAVPHLLLVGGPVVVALTLGGTPGEHRDWIAGGGVLGAVAGVAALIGWFAILFGGTYPRGLRDLATFYLRWRVRGRGRARRRGRQRFSLHTRRDECRARVDRGGSDRLDEVVRAHRDPLREGAAGVRPRDRPEPVDPVPDRAGARADGSRGHDGAPCRRNREQIELLHAAVAARLSAHSL